MELKKSLLCLICGLVATCHGFNKMTELMLSKGVQIRSMAEQYLAYNGLEVQATPDYPYWNFIPDYITSLKIGHKASVWSSPCFKTNKASVSRSEDGKTLNVQITSLDPVSEGTCNDNYMLLTTSTLDLCATIKATKKPSVTTELSYPLPDDITEAELWDIDTKGIRVLRFRHDRPQLVSNLLRTVELFIPEGTLGVPPAVAAANIDFLSKYSKIDIQPRDIALNVPPAENEVHSGDSFYIMRFDGLNPMLAWAMGSTTGHVTTALWIDGALYVCESTTDSAYWPTDYIQKTPYATWINQTIAADMQVVWVPLSETARAQYNETAAVEFFRSVEGLDYGYKTLIWGWLDTIKDNFPCVPTSATDDDYTNCLSWELLEPLLAFLDRNINDVGDMILNPGYAKRLGLDGQWRTADLYQQAAKQGKSAVDVIVVPEDDNWVYNMTRYDEPALGKNMVCCVFVCNTWKAAGVFGALTDSVNCGELTNWDDYVLTIHGDSYRQIVGDYTLKLNDFRTKDPYAHMAETCASKNPLYEKDAHC